MDWRLFFSTFALIFFAELGDKTQLAAMASAAGHRSMWTVFLAASVALVFSTLIAVVFGSVLQRIAPDYVIKTVAGCLFLIFGLLLLFTAWRGREAAVKSPEPAAVIEVHPGFLTRLVLEAALTFEEAAADDYDALAQQVENPELKSLFTVLAEEERRHLSRVSSMTDHKEAPQAATATEKAEKFPRFLWAHGELLDKEMEILAAAIQQEKAKAAFYRAMADDTRLPAARNALIALAQEEEDHVHRLQNVECI